MHKWLYLTSLAALLLLAGMLRGYDIGADLPSYFARGSQDLTTDGAYLTLYAKAAVQFGSWEASDFTTWSAFKISILSAVSYLLFLLFGVSRTVAACAGMVLQLGGLAFFVAGCSRYLQRRTILFIATVLATNYLLVLFGRVPFSEDGLIFFAGLTFFAYTRWFEFDWGKVTVGALIAIGALFGKSLGFLILGGPLLFILMEHEKRNLRSAGLVAAPVLVVTAIYGIFLQSGQGFFNFLYEHGVGQHGTPYGFTSPIAFVESVVAVARTGLHSYTPVLSVAVCLALAAALVGNLQLQRGRPVFYYMVGWLVTWLVVLSPFNYQPVRYHFILIVPMTVLLGVVLECLQESGYSFRRQWTWPRAAALFGLFWYASTSAYIALFVTAFTEDTLREAVWRSSIGALVLTGLVYAISRPVKRRLAGMPRPAIVIAVAVLVIAADFWQFSGWFVRRTHMISDACRDISELVGPTAVFAGQFGPLLTSDSRLQGFPLFVSSDLSNDAEKFQKYPITHVAISKADYQRHVAAGDFLGKAPTLTTLWLRDAYVEVLRVNHLTGNPQAAKYIPTPFEEARELMIAGQVDEAEAIMARVVAEHPRNKLALLEEYYLLLASKDLSAAQPIVDTLYKYVQDDYTVSLLAAVYYKHLAQLPGNPAAFARAEDCRDEALWYGHAEAKTVRLMYDRWEPNIRIVQ